jgi:ATP-dependent Zn protease
MTFGAIGADGRRGWGADGQRDSERTRNRRGVAFHEAGHAIVAWSLGLPVGTIEIRDHDGGGSTQAGYADGCADDLSTVDQIAVSTAGKEAELIFEAPTETWRGNRDNEKILNLTSRLSDGERETVRHAGQKRAKTLLRTHAEKVTKLAAVLIERGQVSGADFLTLISGTDS